MRSVALQLTYLVLWLYVPAVFAIDQLSLSQSIELSNQAPDFGSAYKTKIVRTSAGVLVVVYGEIVEDNSQHYVFDTKQSSERAARDVFVTVCNSANNDCAVNDNWSTPVNISNTALLSSMQTDWNGDGTRTDYYGDSDNPHVFASGNHVVVTWGDKYCPGGEQRSVTYLEFNSREIPMSCVYAAHATGSYATLANWAVDRLSDGSRDVKQDNNKGLGSGVWAVTWQEDPLGLQPGEAEGPGEGSSGAKTSNGADIWYSYTSNVASAVSDIGVWSMPVRITDNHTGYGIKGSFNPIKNAAGNSVNPDQIEKGIAGASRANLQVVGGSNPPNTVIAYEETKGSQGIDEGKFLRYHVFPYNSPPTTAAGKAGCIVSDPAENARRARFVAQTNAASGSGIRFALFWRQGEYTQGGPADIMLRLGYQSSDTGSTGLRPADLDPPVDPDCFALNYAAAVNLTSAAPLNISSNTPIATTDNLFDSTVTNFLENARAHRAVLRANDFYIGYIYTEDGVVADATDLANYNFYLRRFNAMNGVWGRPVNLSNISNTAINVLEPRLIGMPGNGPGCTDPDNITNPENCQNKSVLIAAWGTETNVYQHIGSRENLDIFITRTTDKAAHFEPLITLADGPNSQGESQIRVTPDGNRVFAVWNETGAATNAMFSLGTPITLLSDMAITVTSMPAAVYAGTNIDITYNAENLGPDKAYDIDLTVNLPATVQFLSADDVCIHNAGIVTCRLGDINANESVPINISVQSSIVESLTFSADVAGDTLDDPDTSNNQIESVVNATMASDVRLTASSTQSAVDVGSNVDLVYQVANAGPSQANDIRLILPLPSGAAFVSATPDICNEASGEVRCNIDVLADDGHTTVTIKARVDAIGNSSFNANVTADQFDPEPGNNLTTTVISGIPNADVAVSASASLTSLKEGRHTVISIELINHGPQAASEAQLTVTTPTGWEQRSLTISQGSCRVAGSSFVCDVGNLAAGASSVLRLDGTIDGVARAVFPSSGSAAEQDPNTGNNNASVTVNFTKEKTGIHRFIGCSLNNGANTGGMFDPTLLVILLIAIFNIVRKHHTN